MKRYMCSLVMGVVGLVGSAQAALVTVTVEPSAPAGTVLDNYYTGITLGIEPGGNSLTPNGSVYSYQVAANAAKHAGKMVFAWLATEFAEPFSVSSLDETWTGWKASLKIVFDKPVSWVAIDVLRDDLSDSAELTAFSGVLTGSLGGDLTSNVGWVNDAQTLEFTALPGQFITSILVSGTYQVHWTPAGPVCTGTQAVLLNNLRYAVEAPEPASILCLLGGALGIVGWGWSRRRTASAH